MIARDVGGAVKGKIIDVYIGAKRKNNEAIQLGRKKNQVVTW
jgi:3D (Asp-Asp-Asp) domain-containing protein